MAESGNESRRAKIICTIGPSSQSEEMIRKFIYAGMDVARLNFSHGDMQNHRERIELIRRLSKETGKPVAILQDLQGPKIRIGNFRGGCITLAEDAKFSLTARNVEGNEQIVSISYPEFSGDVKTGDTILLDDGLIKLEVEQIKNDDVHCRVIYGGELSDHKGLNLPGTILSVPALTGKDKKDLEFGLQHDVDYVALSFVQRPEDLQEIREFIKASGKQAPVIAKIEKPQAVDKISEIIDLSDGVMVARGDLGVEVNAEDVPPIQKKIIALCNQRGIPVITATQMLDSMIHNPRPTRAESSDVANAVLDGSDAVMLSGETASGRYPLESVQIMNRIIKNIEQTSGLQHDVRRRRTDDEFSIAQAIGYVACQAADLINAGAIVCLTQTGSTAKMIARYRPKQPILAITPREETLRRMALVWGVSAYFLNEFQDNFDNAVHDALQIVKEKSLLQSGEKVVITAGLPFYRHGISNMLRIEKIE